MFGKEKKPKIPPWNFDLENDLQDKTKEKKIRSSIEANTQQVKGMLRTGGDRKTFDEAQQLLSGYVALQKVVNRVNR